MVNFNVVNSSSDPLFIVKSRREPYKSGYRGIDNCIYFTMNRRRTCVDIYIIIINWFQPECWPQKFLLQLLSLDVCVALKKAPCALCTFYVKSKEEHARNDTPCCSVTVITQKCASSQCLSFSTRLVPKFCPVIHLIEKEKKEIRKSKHTHTILEDTGDKSYFTEANHSMKKEKKRRTWELP